MLGRPDPWLGLTVPGTVLVFLAGSSAKASGTKLLVHTHFTLLDFTRNPKLEKEMPHKQNWLRMKYRLKKEKHEQFCSMGPKT